MTRFKADTSLNIEAKTDRQKEELESAAKWCGFYRANIPRFVKDFLHISLRLFQIFLLVMMDIASVFVFIACRGIGKTFMCAVYCVVRAVLYPGTKICVASGTKGQAAMVLEKIMTELKPNSPELAYEIDDKNTRIGGEKPMIMFKNGSFIKVVAASDNARSNRAHLLIIDEARMVKKETIDTILKKFLSSQREPKYFENPEYAKYPREPLKTFYLSSAHFKDHWLFQKCKDACRYMLDDTRRDFVCGFPYQLSLAEHLLPKERVIEDMTETGFSEITWMMEMGAEFFGGAGGTFFDFNTVSKNRKIMYPMLPNEQAGYLNNSAKVKIPPKQPGELRILSMDVALMASRKYKNDASSVFINQLLPTKANVYCSNIVYTTTWEGMHSADQALRVRRLYDEYDCDYIVIDGKGVGMAVVDVLLRDIVDPDTGEIYPSLSCCNDENIAVRCSDKSAKKAIWVVQGSSRFNSDCAVLLREGFKTGKIRLLVTECDGENALNEIKGFAPLDESSKAEIMLPYVETTLLIRELTNLLHEETGGTIKISEKRSMRKDRYSSLSYNYYVACQLEGKLRKRDVRLKEPCEEFLFRAPKIK